MGTRQERKAAAFPFTALLKLNMPLSSSRTARTVHEATCVKVNCERTHLVPQFARSNLRSRTGAALSGRSSPVEQLFAAPVRLTGKVSIAVSVCRTHCGTLKSAPYSCCDTCTSPNAAPPRLPLSLCSFVVKSLDLVPSSLLRILEVECLASSLPPRVRPLSCRRLNSPET